MALLESKMSSFDKKNLSTSSVTIAKTKVLLPTHIESYPELETRHGNNL